jgi:hypothetical protein
MRAGQLINREIQEKKITAVLLLLNDKSGDVAPLLPSIGKVKMSQSY